MSSNGRIHDEVCDQDGLAELYALFEKSDAALKFYLESMASAYWIGQMKKALELVGNFLPFENLLLEKICSLQEPTKRSVAKRASKYVKDIIRMRDEERLSFGRIASKLPRRTNGRPCSAQNVRKLYTKWKPRLSPDPCLDQSLEAVNRLREGLVRVYDLYRKYGKTALYQHLDSILSARTNR